MQIKFDNPVMSYGRTLKTKVTTKINKRKNAKELKSFVDRLAEINEMATVLQEKSQNLITEMSKKTA